MGLDGDGPITLSCGIAVTVFALLAALGVVPRWGALVAAGFGGLGVIVAVVDILDVQDTIDEIEALGNTASIGPALWVCLAGGLAALALGLLAFVNARRPST